MAPNRQRVALGAYGERIAERHLSRLGMVLLDRNWRCSTGEIDLVLRDGNVLVVCEVKTRRDLTRGHPVEAVREDKVARLATLALLWRESRGVVAHDVRLDLVGILAPRRGPVVIEHVRGIG